MPAMDSCIFCKIIAGEVPSAKIYENEDVLAFLDINPVNPGHTLVVPKKHCKNFYETPDDVLAKLIAVSKKVTHAMKRGLDADGTNITLNNDPAAGQVVEHTHIHVIPRHAGDGLRLWPQKPYPEGEMDRARDALRAALGEE